MISLEWIGGFFDADGYVGLSKNERQGKGVSYIPILGIGQSDKGLLDQIATVLDAKVYLHRKAGYSNDWDVRVNRNAYCLRASNSQAVRIAKLLIPVTVSKTRELEQVVEFYEQYNNYTKGWARYGGAEYLKRCDEMIQAGDACRARLNLIRSNKDTIDVGF